MRDYEMLNVGIDDDVFTIKFDNPEKRNAVNGTAHGELSHVFKDAYDSDARVVVLTGKGKAFSAGGDFDRMEEVATDQEELLDSMKESEEIIESLLNLEKPIVAAVNGDAIGLGCTLALFCDIVVTTTEAKIGDPHTSVGIVPGDGGAVMWPLLVGINNAKELLMTGTVMSGEEASDIGLVNHAVPESEFDDKVDEIVDDLASGPQTALRYTKMALNGWIEMGMNNIFREAMALQKLTQQSNDHREAVAALKEGERPNFPSGRDPDSDSS